MKRQHYSFSEALIDPKRVFGLPENVVSDPRLDRPAKLEILRKWREDARALSVAEYEGMAGGEATMLQRVQQAIYRLIRNDN